MALVAGLLGVLQPSAVKSFFTESQSQARADVQIHPIIGTYASFEVVSYSSDFVASYTTPQAAARAAAATGDPASVVAVQLVAERSGVNGGAAVSFTSSTPGKAEAGLRAAAQEAARQVAQSNVDRARVQLAAAEKALSGIDEGFVVEGSPLSAAPPGDIQAARKAAFSQATDRVESRIAALEAAQKSLDASDRVVAPVTVAVSPVTYLTARVYVAAAAVGCAILLTLGWALLPLLKRRGTAEPRGGEGTRRTAW